MSSLFTKKSQAIFWNNNVKAIQRMLDYGYICRRETPSVSAIVHPTSQSSVQKFFFGPQEIVIPITKTIEEAVELCPNSDCFLNFASFRTAYDVTIEALQFTNFKTVMVTAEGIPERFARQMVSLAKKKGITLVGPSTVGAITPGALKTGNIGGTIENIAKTRLHRPGSVGLVTRSGGLFNELCNIISLNSDGIAEGIAVGGDRFPGSTFIDHMLRMEKMPEIKLMVLLGEVGGTDEYEIINAVNAGKITKPIIALCTGTVAQHLSSGVQFGHAGAKANAEEEEAAAKNNALKKAGFHVPESFNELPKLIKTVYSDIKAKENTPEEDILEVPEIPEDYITAKKSGKIRKTTNFICTISDDRGDEAVYAGHPISSVATPETGFSIGDVVSLLWFKKQYPKWASDFIETVIKTVADHGPAVSGAHNTRVTSRAGKDLISSIVSGLLTIGPRFGGAIDGAAKYFKYGYDQEMTPNGFVEYMKKKGIPIPGIGHRIKSLKNPDLRVNALRDYAKKQFPETKILDYASEVELVTTSKKGNLILNVDGVVGVLLVDMWKALGYSDEEIEHYIESGALNAFFVLGRSIGFIGHYLDEKRLNMPLYRHDLDDILYDVEKAESVTQV
ncbi:ATP citrate synthase [Candidatus Marinamargulisbacteria bacterium SCGC AG-439-L15]|nr:ATP citrate synthase [Candidatus Marinamargulisbacteria bacterium SCGC AG-439-L15]